MFNRKKRDASVSFSKPESIFCPQDNHFQTTSHSSLQCFHHHTSLLKDEAILSSNYPNSVLEKLNSRKCTLGSHTIIEKAWVDQEEQEEEILLHFCNIISRYTALQQSQAALVTSTSPFRRCDNAYGFQHISPSKLSLIKGLNHLLINFILKHWCQLIMYFLYSSLQPHYFKMQSSMESCQKRENTQSTICDPQDLKMSQLLSCWF